MLSRILTSRTPCVVKSFATNCVAATRTCVVSAPRIVATSSSRYVSSDKSRQDAPSMANTIQRSSRKSNVPLYGVPLEQVPTSTDIGDSDLTLGEEVKRNYRQTSASFVDLRIGDVLHRKAKYGNTLHTISESESVAKALQAMNHLSIGAILVTAEDNMQSIVGIFSSRDLIRCVDDGVLGTIDAKRLPVSEVMSRDPVFAYSDTTALQAMQMMTEGGFRHLPVRDRHSQRYVGLISIGDLVRTVMSEHEQKNEFLEDLVSGKYPA